MAAEFDLTLDQLRGRLLAEKSFKAGISVVWRFIERHGISFGKKTLHAGEQDRLDVQAAREVWQEAQPGIGPKRQTFIGET